MRTTFGRFCRELFLKVHCYTIINYCGSLTKFSVILEDLFRSSRECPSFILIFDWEPLIRVLLLFWRNFSVGPIFMTQPVFQSLLVDHIWMLLLLQKIFSEVPVLMLLYPIVDHLHGCFSCFRWLFSRSRISPVI